MLQIALLAVAVLFASPASGQSPTPATPESASPAAATTKQCDTATRRAAKEQRSLAFTDEEIARDKKGRESCATQGACTRYDAAIKSMEERKTRHETRLAKFKADAEKICKEE